MSEERTPVGLKTIQLYSQECVDLLRQALDKAEADLKLTLTYYDTRRKNNGESSEEEEKESGSDDESLSSSSQEDDSDHEEETRSLTAIEEVDASASTNSGDDKSPKQSILEENKTRPKRLLKKKPKERQQEALMQQMGTPPMLQLPIDNIFALNVPSAMLDKHERHYSTASCTLLWKLSQNLASSQPVIVLLLRSGRFAGGVFSKDLCLQHRACQRYTVRKGQGKAQSTQDGSRRPKSMGAQLRRQGEVNLWQDVRETLQQWNKYLQQSPLVLVSCPKTMQKGLLETAGDLLDRNLIRKIPLDVGRPTFESACAAYEIMMQVFVREMTTMQSKEDAVDESAVDHATIEAEKEKKPEGTVQEKVVVSREFPPLTPLHTFAAEGNAKALQDLLESVPEACYELMDHGAGPDYMTPLHLAADSASMDVDPATAASIVSLLLVQGHANPCTVDARNRVPYFLASQEKVREAFRHARAELGEDKWAWDAAKVGPALTEEDLASKKEKAAEKKRRQRARQKEKKARERAEAIAMEEGKKEEEEKRKQEEDAKRIRDGLAPKKSNATNVCDYCQTECKGKRRNQMFHRLDYAYCSSECVQKHKRELMAQAALSRLG